jgi:hypothetical protein
MTAGSCAAAALVACGNSSGGGSSEDAGSDHSTVDSTAGDSGQDTGTKDSAAGDTGNNEGSAGEGGVDAGDSGDAATSCQLFDAAGLDEASVQAGFVQVWQVYKCYKCHQNPTDVVDDAGNGILLNGNTVGLGDSGTIFPPNLTNSAQGLGCWTDPQVATAILEGRDTEGGALCPPMPVFGTDASTPGRPMDAGTAQEIIDYIRSLQPSSQTTPDTTCSSGGGDGGGDAPSDGPDGG